MKRRLLLLLLLAPVIYGASQERPVTRKAIVRSAILQEDEEVWISVPYHYNHIDHKFPVLFVMDADGHFNYLSAYLDYLANDYVYNIPEFILVGIRSPTSAWRSKLIPAFSDTVTTIHTGQNLLKFVIDELTPWIEQQYRASDYHVIAGHSMGGSFSTYAWLTHPEFFNNAIAVSPTLGGRLLENFSSMIAATSAIHPTAYALSVSKNDLTNYFRFAMQWKDSLLKYRNIVPVNFRVYDSTLDHYTVAPAAIWDGLQDLYRGWRFAINTDSSIASLDQLVDEPQHQWKTSYPKELAYHRLGRALINAANKDRLKSLLHHWEKQFPNSILYHWYAARYHALLGDKKSAIKHVDQSILEAKKMQSPLLPQLEQTKISITQTN